MCVYPVCVGSVQVTLVSARHRVFVGFRSVSWPVSVSVCCVDHRANSQDSVDSGVVLVVVLHHAFDVEQFVSQPATLFLLRLVVWCLQSRESTDGSFNTTKQGC